MERISVIEIHKIENWNFENVEVSLKQTVIGNSHSIIEPNNELLEYFQRYNQKRLKILIQSLHIWGFLLWFGLYCYFCSGNDMNEIKMIKTVFKETLRINRIYFNFNVNSIIFEILLSF